MALLEAMDAPPVGPAGQRADQRRRARLPARARTGRTDCWNGPTRCRPTAPPVPVNDRAALSLGMYLKVVDRFDESRTWLQTVRTAAVDEGDDSALPNVLGHLATLECWAGRYDLALAHAVEGRERAVRTGLRSPMADLGARARAGPPRPAGRGPRPRRGRPRRRRGARLRRGRALHQRSLGVAELMAGDAAAGGRAPRCGRWPSPSTRSASANRRSCALTRTRSTALVALGRIDEAHG